MMDFLHILRLWALQTKNWFLIEIDPAGNSYRIMVYSEYAQPFADVCPDIPLWEVEAPSYIEVMELAIGKLGDE